MLPAQTQTELWTRVLTRLHAGEALVTPEDFCVALDCEYQALCGDPLPAGRRSQFHALVRHLHADHPQTYLAQGVKNAVCRAFADCAVRLSWGREQVESSGWQAIRRFLRSDGVRELLAEHRLDASIIDPTAALRRAIDSLEPGRRGGLPSGSASASPATESPASGPPAAAPDGATPRSNGSRRYAPLERSVAAAAEAAGLNPRAAADRIAEQEGLHLELTQREATHLPERLDAFVADGVIEAEEADKVRQLLQVDARETAGELDAAAAEHEREQILTLDHRMEVDARLRTAVDGTVGYLQVFESLKRIRPDVDAFLKLLVTHKKVVGGSGDRTPLLTTLSTSTGLLEQATALMDRTDPEIRLLAVRLPPYGNVVPQRLQPIAHLTVEPGFIEDLRTCTTDDISERFRAPEPAQRARPAADILSFVHLLDQVLEPTPFRMKLRMLVTNQILHEVRPRLEELYAEGDVEAARPMAERILRQRLERRFVSASREEQAAALKRAQAVLQAIEQKVMAHGDGSEQVETALAEVDAAGAAGAEAAGGADDRLTEMEVKLGAQLARVEMRIAGGRKRIMTKLMPDPDDPEVLVMARRDPETGQLQPQIRRGQKRHVERGTDGIWRAV